MLNKSINFIKKTCSMYSLMYRQTNRLIDHFCSIIQILISPFHFAEFHLTNPCFSLTLSFLPQCHILSLFNSVPSGKALAQAITYCSDEIPHKYCVFPRRLVQIESHFNKPIVSHLNQGEEPSIVRGAWWKWPRLI